MKAFPAADADDFHRLGAVRNFVCRVVDDKSRWQTSIFSHCCQWTADQPPSSLHYLCAFFSQITPCLLCIGINALQTLGVLPFPSPFSRYLALNILGSRPWPFKVTWRHRSRDDSIPHIGFPIGAPLEPSPYLQAFSRYLALKCLSNANRHCACAISRDLYHVCQIWVHIWISHPHFAYSLWHFYWAPMRIKGCLLVRHPIMLNAKSSENFLSRPKLGKFWRFWGSGGQSFQKVAIFTPKGTSLREPTSLSHFASKSVEGCDLQVGWGKNRESHWASHRKDMSPLTQGLNYRSACDYSSRKLILILLSHGG